MISISGFCIHSLGFSHKNIWVLGSPQRLQVTSSAATSPTIERLNRQSEFHFGANFGMFWKFEHGIIEQLSTISPGGQDKAPGVNVRMCIVMFCVLFPVERMLDGGLAKTAYRFCRMGFYFEYFLNDIWAFRKIHQLACQGIHPHLDGPVYFPRVWSSAKCSNQSSKSLDSD